MSTTRISPVRRFSRGFPLLAAFALATAAHAAPQAGFFIEEPEGDFLLTGEVCDSFSFHVDYSNAQCARTSLVFEYSLDGSAWLPMTLWMDEDDGANPRVIENGCGSRDVVWDYAYDLTPGHGYGSLDTEVLTRVRQALPYPADQAAAGGTDASVTRTLPAEQLSRNFTLMLTIGGDEAEPASDMVLAKPVEAITLHGPACQDGVFRLAWKNMVREWPFHIPDGESSLVVPFGTDLPDEGVVSMSVEWTRAGSPLLTQTFDNILVDRLAPRFVHALAPAGDFWADLPDPEFVSHLEYLPPTPGSAYSVSFYSSSAYDLGSPNGIEYRVLIWSHDGYAANPLEPDLYTGAWSSSPAPVDTFALGSEESFGPASKMLQRGRYPRNVWARRGEWENVNVNVDGVAVDGELRGEYIWEVEARDAAGNWSRSTPSEVWVPFAGDSLFACLYKDNVTRFRIPTWMPKDHFVPKLSTAAPTSDHIAEYNGEWSPYLEWKSRHLGASNAAMQNALDGFSPTVFDGPTAALRNQQYAEYAWSEFRRWEYYIQSMAADLEKQSRHPVGPTFGPYYPEPLIASSRRFAMNYSKLADGRMRPEFWRDSVQTERGYFNPSDLPESYQSRRFAGLWTSLPELMGGQPGASPNYGELVKQSQLALSMDFSGYEWYWAAFPAFNVSRDGSGTSFALVTPTGQRGVDTIDGLHLQNGGATLCRSQASGGEAGTAALRMYQAADPLEAVQQPAPTPGAPLPPLQFSNSFAEMGQLYLQRRAMDSRPTSPTMPLCPESRACRHSSGGRSRCSSSPMDDTPTHLARAGCAGAPVSDRVP